MSAETNSTWTLYLIRHAQSDNNARPEHDRIPDPGITSLGREQTEYLARCLDDYAPTLYYCSPFLRTLQTLQPIAATLQLTPIVRGDLFEQGGCYAGYKIGERQARPGMGRSQIATCYPGWIIDPSIPETGWNQLQHYESIDEARQRARRVKAWFESESSHQKHRVAMMIHADFKLRMLEALLEIEDLEPHFEEPYNTSISCLVRKQNRWQLRFWNHHQHLPIHLRTT